MTTIRHIAHAVVWFKPEVEVRVHELARLQSSAVRSAYQAIYKHGLRGNEVKKRVKLHYAADLNQRYVADACLLASEISQKHAIFGGRKCWKDLVERKITKDEWHSHRDNQLYSRGDRTKQSNPNLRIVGDRLLVNDPSQRGRWIEGRLWLPRKFRDGLDFACYDVRLLFRNSKIEVKIGWKEASPTIKTTAANGVIGVDANPDGCAITETDADGNLKWHRYIKKQRLSFARKTKRANDVRLLAKEVVEVAETASKPLVVEDLKFGRKKKGKKFNRMAGNFLHRQMIEAIQRRAARQGVEVRKVNPAFTSALGRLKYGKLYSLNRHTAAALVIGRRGQGFVEQQTFTVTPKGESGKKLNLAGRGVSLTLSPKAWSWLQDCFLKPNPAILTGSPLAPPRGIRGSVGELPTGEPAPTTGRCGVGLTYSAGERTAFGNLEPCVRVS